MKRINNLTLAKMEQKRDAICQKAIIIQNNAGVVQQHLDDSEQKYQEMKLKAIPIHQNQESIQLTVNLLFIL